MLQFNQDRFNTQTPSPTTVPSSASGPPIHLALPPTASGLHPCHMAQGLRVAEACMPRTQPDGCEVHLAESLTVSYPTSTITDPALSRPPAAGLSAMPPGAPGVLLTWPPRPLSMAPAVLTITVTPTETEKRDLNENSVSWLI